MNQTDSTFVFRGWENEDPHVVHFHYAAVLRDKTYEFTERLILPHRGLKSKVSGALLHRVLDHLFLMLGVSYWKLFCPAIIDTGPLTLTADEAAFWNIVYTKGLGEFFYKNRLDFRGLVQFPYKENVRSPFSCHVKNRSLVQLGGGKDSSVTAELLTKYNKRFDLACLDPKSVHKSMAHLIGRSLRRVRRIIDPKLLELTHAGVAYHGHVPVSAIYAFVNLLLAIIEGWRYIIASNEESANYGNVTYLGTSINHQWSKSLEFEELFRDYVSRFVTPDVTYFSLLRPLTEIHIVKLFSHYSKYFSTFTSCNTNFRISDEAKDRWCSTCPKCAFVFLLLAAFLPRRSLVDIFGKNLFEDVSLLPVYNALLGLATIKPFECVGTPEESRFALWTVMENDAYTRDPVIERLAVLHPIDVRQKNELKQSLFTPKSSHLVPKEFQPLIKGI